MAELPSQDYLKSRIDYNPETGEARWKPVDESFGPRWKTFNIKHSGNKLPESIMKIKGKPFSTARILYKIFYGIDPAGSIRFQDKDQANTKISNLIATGNVEYKDNTYLKSYRELPTDASELLEYNPHTGYFTWLERGQSNFNSRFAGKAAGYIGSSGYKIISIHNNAYQAHRIAWFMYYGIDPKNYYIDHIDGCRSNNSILNLRLATHSFNSQMAHPDSVGYRPHRNKFRAAISIAGITKNLGTFDTEAEAKAAYEQALAKYKPIYQFTEEEQAELDELYANYPNVSRELQHRCHALQVKALNHYIEGAAQ